MIKAYLSSSEPEEISMAADPVNLLAQGRCSNHAGSGDSLMLPAPPPYEYPAILGIRAMIRMTGIRA
jgi:hypothetical protein